MPNEQLSAGAKTHSGLGPTGGTSLARFLGVGKGRSRRQLAAVSPLVFVSREPAVSLPASSLASDEHGRGISHQAELSVEQAPSQRQTGTVYPQGLVLPGHTGVPVGFPFSSPFLSLCVCRAGGGSVVVVVVGEPVNVTAKLLLSHRAGGGQLLRSHGALAGILVSAASHRPSSPASIFLIPAGTWLESHDSLIADRWRHTTQFAPGKFINGTFLGAQ